MNYDDLEYEQMLAREKAVIDGLTRKFLNAPPVKIGVDWAGGSGLNRGDISKLDGNVVHVRFKAVSFD